MNPCRIVALIAQTRTRPWPAPRMLTLLLTAILLFPISFGFVPDAEAQANQGDAAARLQIIIRRVHIYNDMDWGEGDFTLHGWVLRVKDGCAATSLENSCLAEILKIGAFQFSGNDGDDITFNRTIPSAADTPRDTSVTREGGISVVDGKAYRIVFVATEDDAAIADQMGRLDKVINRGNDWGVGGPRTERGSLDLSGHGDGSPAHYSVEYEIRRTALADLVPYQMIIAEGPTPSIQDEVCVRVRNSGSKASSQINLSLFRGSSGSPIASTSVPGLAAGSTTTPCIHTALPAGQYPLTGVVTTSLDQNETNNKIVQQYTSAGSVIGPLPGFAPTVNAPQSSR